MDRFIGSRCRYKSHSHCNYLVAVMTDSFPLDSVSSQGSFVVESILPWALRIGTVAAGIVAIVGGFLYVKQESLLYFPEIGGIPKRPTHNPKGYRSPGERQIPFKDCDIVCSDGVHIHAWLMTFDKDAPTIIFFHGNAGNIGLRLPNAIQMRSYLQCNILMVEYRGYGESDNVPPSEAGLKLDAQGALQYAVKFADQLEIDASKLFLFGRSLGGAVAFDLADYARRENIPLRGVMVENTFLSISAMVDKLMPFLKPIKPFVLRLSWDSTKIVPSLNLPILFLAGSKDELVPHEHMQHLMLMAQASRLKQFHVIDGGTHNESWIQGGAEYWNAMKSFMVQAMQGTSGERISASPNAGFVAPSAEATIPTMSSNFGAIISGHAVIAPPQVKKEK
ncbi:hypothetical protein MPSEU_000888800 [Mayamaea pseudoterrestris]|nr:hypothetical protein MPSEU_000888800 [Mayamaea pseudoterrestris]